jgi:hypothetical protein
VSAIFQATAEIDDLDRFFSAVEWLRDGVEHPEGFVSLRVFQDQSRPRRVTLIEEWTQSDAFLISLRRMGPSAGPEFLARAGITVDQFESCLWTLADVLPVVPT